MMVVLIVIAVVYFRDPSSRFDSGDGDVDRDFAATGRSDEVDEASKEFAKKTGVDAKTVVSTGQSIVSTKFLCTVTSWEVGKDVLKYELPEGASLEDYGVMTDENGYITNEYSYVIVHFSAQNISDKKIENDYLWSKLRLRFVNPPSSYSVTGEVRYLGEKQPRKFTDDYFAENFEVDETKEIALIYAVPDGILDNDGMYLELNPMGAVITDEDQDVRRYLLLN